MRSMLKPAARAPGLILGALLITAAGAVLAAGEIMPPLPGAPPQSQAPGIAEAAPGAAAGTTESREPSSEHGSRLLRTLAKRPEPGVVLPEDTAPVFAAVGCPRALLRRLLAGAVDESGALSALAIEREALTLCRERQEIVAGLFETEARLRELRAPAAAPAVPAAVPAPAVRESPAFEPESPSRLRAALAAAAGTPEAARPPDYGWFSIIGSKGALRAGVTDGQHVWFVREGDPLPGGTAVGAIAGRPPGVRVTAPGKNGEESLLPYRARPGDGP